MKKALSISILAIALLSSCNQNSKTAETNPGQQIDTTSAMYACPMHPEITGNQGDKCSKCGMELTEKVGFK